MYATCRQHASALTLTHCALARTHSLQADFTSGAVHDAEAMEGEAAQLAPATEAAQREAAELEAALAAAMAERDARAKARVTNAEKALEAAAFYDKLTRCVNAAVGL